MQTTPYRSRRARGHQRGRTCQLSFQAPPKLVDAINDLADRERRSRSNLIARLLERALEAELTSAT